MSKSEYFDALKRLREGTPIRVPVGTPINYDSVALEAGRKKGSIKRARTSFAELRAEIAKDSPPLMPEADRISKLEDEVAKFKSLYEQAVGREISLMWQLHELTHLPTDNVLPFSAAGNKS